MKKGLNFRTIERQKEYFEAYEKALKLIAMPVVDIITGRQEVR